MRLQFDLPNAVAIALKCSNCEYHPVPQDGKVGLNQITHSSLESQCDSTD